MMNAEAQREVTGVNSRQAINLLKGLEQSLDDYCELNDEGENAFRMAITALELFGIPEGLEVLCAIALGYPDEEKSEYDLARLKYEKVHYL